MNTGKQTYKFSFSLKGYVYYIYVCVSPKTYWKFRGYVIDNCFKLILFCMNKRYFPLKEKYSYFQSNYSIYSNKFPLPFHQVWEQHCSAYRLHIARATFLWLKLSIKATFIITSALSTTCRQLPGMVFLLPTLRYGAFALWYKRARQRNFASHNRVKEKWLLTQEQLYQSAMQSTLLTIHCLTQLPQMHFLTHASHSTVNGYLNSCFVKSPFEETNYKICLLRGAATWATNSCSSQIKNVLFWSFFEYRTTVLFNLPSEVSM